MTARRREEPPHDLDVERALLGAMVLSPAALTDALACGITAGDFYAPKHQFIFGAITSLAADGAPVDIVTVADHLRRLDLLDNAGGADYLLDLQAAVPAVGNAPRYVRRVQETAQLRRVITVATNVIDDAYSEPADIGVLLVDAQDRFQAIAATNGANPFRDRLVRGTDAAVAVMPPRALVDGLLFTPSVAVPHGAPKTGKSVVALDLALHVAAGRPFWYGRASLVAACFTSLAKVSEVCRSASRPG
jgi:hypothetical protein